MNITKGSTNVSITIRIVDSTDGTPETGVVWNTAGIDMQYRREGAASTAITEATLAALTTAHTDGGFLHIGNGYYRLDVPDAAFASGVDGVLIHGAVTGMVVIGVYVQLTDVDLFDAVRGGMTALPNAAADAAGGLPISDLGGLDLDTKLANTNEVTAARMGALTDWINGGRLDLLLDAVKAVTDLLPNAGALTTLITHLTDIKGATFSGATDSLESIRDRGDAAWTTGAGGSDRLLMADTTIATLASQTSFTLTAGSADDNAYNNCTIVVEDVSTATQKAVGMVLAYTGSTKTVTLKEALAFTIATTDKVYILAENSLKSTVANRQLDVTATGAAGIDWGNIENPTTAVDLSGTDIQLVDTTTTNTDMRGTDSAALASVCTEARLSELDAVTAGKMANQVDIIQTDTTTDIPALIATAQADLDIITDTDGVILGAAGVDLILDEAVSAHQAVGSIGRAITVAGSVSLDTTASGTPSTTVIALNAGSATDNFYTDQTCEIVSGVGAGQARIVTSYTGATNTLNFDEAFNIAPAASDNIILRQNHIHAVSQIVAGVVADPVIAELTTQGDTNEAKLDVIDGIVDTILVDTADMQPKLGTPAGLSMSADIAAVKADTAAILIDTNELQGDWTNGGRLDLIIDAILADTGTDGVVLTAAERNAIADAILDRNMATGVDSGSATVRTVRQALRSNRNKVSISAGTMTVTKEDDTTASWTAAVTTTAGNPISAIDPADA